MANLEDYIIGIEKVTVVVGAEQIPVVCIRLSNDVPLTVSMDRRTVAGLIGSAISGIVAAGIWTDTAASGIFPAELSNTSETSTIAGLTGQWEKRYEYYARGWKYALGTLSWRPFVGSGTYNFVARYLESSGYGVITAQPAVMYVRGETGYNVLTTTDPVAYYFTFDGTVDSAQLVAIGAKTPGVNLSTVTPRTASQPRTNPITFSFTNTVMDITAMVIEPGPTPPPGGNDPYSGGGTSEPGGGGGDYTLVNDPIDFPDTPTISVAQAGFVSIWIPTLSQIQDLANFMWNADPLKIDFWKKLIANPLELILGLQLVPFEVPTETNPASVTLGIIDSEIEMNYTDQQYHEIECGSLDLTEYWGGFLDYAPFTSVDIFLPYIGVRSLNVNDCMPKTIAVKYKVDIVSGACVAIVKCGDSVIYHFPGNIAAQVPVTTLQMQQIVGGVMQAAVSIGTAVATGGIGGAVAAALGASTAIANTGTHSDRSGSVAGNVGFMDNQMPYLIVTRPRQAVPEEQNKYTGYPAYITVSLADLTGYTEVNIVHLQGLSCTKAEAEEITRLLLEGVIF